MIDILRERWKVVVAGGVIVLAIVALILVLVVFKAETPDDVVRGFFKSVDTGRTDRMMEAFDPLVLEKDANHSLESTLVGRFMDDQRGIVWSPAISCRTQVSEDGNSATVEVMSSSGKLNRSVIQPVDEQTLTIATIDLSKKAGRWYIEQFALGRF